jgi:putative flippase GtrA
MIAIKYTLFAIISTLLNLLFQYLSFFVYVGFASLYVAMFVGTLVGLVSKYILDKKYIFYHTPKNKTDDAKKFMLYSLVGVFTTAIFWGTEIGFDALFNSEIVKNIGAINGLSSESVKCIVAVIGLNGESAKYIGAVIGLSIGYVTKYFLDKKFVFKDLAS